MDRSIDLGSWERRATGDGVVFVDRAAGTRLRIRPRIAPRRFAAIASEIAAEHGLDPAPELARRHLVTDEGELGVIAAGRAGNTDLAFALTGDDPLSCIDAAGAPAAGVAALVESLARSLSAGRGRLRARMFEYEPPPWPGVRRASQTLWAHPDGARAVIAVHDARPLSTCSNERLHRLLFLRLGDQPGTVTGDSSPIESRFGLSGRVRETQTRGPGGSLRRAAAFGDDRFIYQATIAVSTRGDGEALAVFDQLIDSFRPLPSPSLHGGPGLAHWAE
jgi:hypothetical protein